MPAEVCSTRTRIEKLGIKAGHRVAILGVKDADLDAELARAGADFSFRARKDCDYIFFAADSEPALAKLGGTRASLKQNGAVWVIYPKGVKHITQAQVMAGIKAAGLVDIKVCSFSTTHTGLKSVIPVAQRRSS